MSEHQSFFPTTVRPVATIESEWGSYARVQVETSDGQRLNAIWDELTDQFQVPYEGSEIGNVIKWRHRSNP